MFKLDSNGAIEKNNQTSFLEFELPLSLFIKTSTAFKDAVYKLTLNTDKDALSVKL